MVSERDQVQREVISFVLFMSAPFGSLGHIANSEPETANIIERTEFQRSFRKRVAQPFPIGELGTLDSLFCPSRLFVHGNLPHTPWHRSAVLSLPLYSPFCM